MATEISRLQRQLLEHPEDVQAWELLAQLVSSSRMHPANVAESPQPPPVSPSTYTLSTNESSESQPDAAEAGKAERERELELLQRGMPSEPSIADYTAEDIFNVPAACR